MSAGEIAFIAKAQFYRPKAGYGTRLRVIAFQHFLKRAALQLFESSALIPIVLKVSATPATLGPLTTHQLHSMLSGRERIHHLAHELFAVVT